MSANLNFVRQQGFVSCTPTSCGYEFPALMWQPRVTAVLVLLGILLESGWFFIVLAAIVCWSVVVPGWSPFDAIYYHLVLKRRGHPRLAPAPAPRRFAQALATAFMLAIGVAMLTGRDELAWSLQRILLLFLMLLIFGRFCVGSYLWHLLTRGLTVANQTLPWKRSE